MCVYMIKFIFDLAWEIANFLMFDFIYKILTLINSSVLMET